MDRIILAFYGTQSHFVAKQISEKERVPLFSFKKPCSCISNHFNVSKDRRRELINDLYKIGLKYDKGQWIVKFDNKVFSPYFIKKNILVERIHSQQEYDYIRGIGGYVILCGDSDVKRLTWCDYAVPTRKDALDLARKLLKERK